MEEKNEVILNLKAETYLKKLVWGNNYHHVASSFNNHHLLWSHAIVMDAVSGLELSF